MFGKRHKDNGEKVFRYSIRKYHFGAASVAIAALIFFANGVAQAETLAVRPETANVQSSPEGEPSDSGGRAVSEIQPAEQPKVLTQSVNKDALRIAIGNLSDVVRKVESSKLVALESQLTQVVEESKRLLEDGDATEQAVATEVETINSLIREVEKLLPKPEPTVGEPTDKKDKEASIEHPKDEKKVVSDQEKSKKDLSTVDKDKLNEDRAAVNQGSEDRLTSNPNKVEKTVEEVAKKELPTYSNENDGAANLSNELYFIYGELRKANTDTSKIQEVKDAYDKINNAIPLANNGVVNQAIFDAALVDLKKARDLIESVLNGKTTDNSTTTPVNPQPRSGDEELPSRGRGRRVSRSVRVGTENYDNSLESFFEDGKKGNSPYDKYTYVFYSRRQANAIDGANRRVEESRNQIYADVTPTNDGFKWDIYINRSRYDLSDSVAWFTIPSGQDLKSGSVDISWKSNEGTHATSPNDGTISGALREAGFRNVTEGTPQNSRVDKSGGSTVNKKYLSGSLRALSHQGGITGQNPYKKNLETPQETALAEKKFDTIERSAGKLFYFELNQDWKTYHLSFETRGNNDITKLAYAVGMKGERTDDDNPRIRVRFLVNQWYARTDGEKDDTDTFKFKIKGNGYFKIKQNTVNPIFVTNNEWYEKTKNNITYKNRGSFAEKPLDSKVDGVLTYNSAGDITDYRNIDTTSYGDYYREDGSMWEKQEGKGEANRKGQNFQLFKDSNGAVTNISREDLTVDAISTPGVHAYRYNRSFSDGSHDTGKFYFVTKPKTPTLTTDLARQAGKTIDIQANNGTNGYEMRLYKRAANGSLTEVLGANGKPLTATAGANGVATFTNVKVEEADYVVKTVVEGKWVDYDNTRHSTVESDESNKKTATDGVPPVVRIAGGVTLPETSPLDAIYTVTQGQAFAPNLEAFDNTGKITKFEFRGDLPTGVNLSSNVSSTANYTETSPYRAIFTGAVSNTMEPGVYTRTIIVGDGKTSDKTYYFKYKVLPKAPTITTEPKYDGTLVSTDRSISGTGHPGATIKVTLQDGKTGETRVNNDGSWKYNLTNDQTLTQNFKSDATTKATKPVSIKQVKNDAESEEATVNVKLARAISIEPVVQAGRDITVKIPHDAGLFYLQVFHGNNQKYEYTVRKTGNTWAITDQNQANITELRVANGDKCV